MAFLQLRNVHILFKKSLYNKKFAGYDSNHKNDFHTLQISERGIFMHEETKIDINQLVADIESLDKEEIEKIKEFIYLCTNQQELLTMLVARWSASLYH